MPDNKIISLYRNLLDISEQEQAEITNNNIDMLEEYSLKRDEIMKELEGLNKSESASQFYIENTEIRGIIEKIFAINEQNIKNVQALRDTIVTDASAIQTNRNARRAYISAGQTDSV
ncbi:MAG: hypothetical protein M1147_12675 [Nitrospirae bacterium]|nr:hypothetical protein [Nitrospirota bacterium]MCL5978945.1 hypothetical protein [Nitrospirota bacterium]